MMQVELANGTIVELSDTEVTELLHPYTPDAEGNLQLVFNTPKEKGRFHDDADPGVVTVALVAAGHDASWRSDSRRSWLEYAHPGKENRTVVDELMLPAAEVVRGILEHAAGVGEFSPLMDRVMQWAEGQRRPDGSVKQEERRVWRESHRILPVVAYNLAGEIIPIQAGVDRAHKLAVDRVTYEGRIRTLEAQAAQYGYTREELDAVGEKVVGVRLRTGDPIPAEDNLPGVYWPLKGVADGDEFLVETLTGLHVMRYHDSVVLNGAHDLPERYADRVRLLNICPPTTMAAAMVIAAGGVAASPWSDLRIGEVDAALFGAERRKVIDAVGDTSETFGAHLRAWRDASRKKPAIMMIPGGGVFVYGPAMEAIRKAAFDAAVEAAQNGQDGDSE